MNGVKIAEKVFKALFWDNAVMTAVASLGITWGPLASFVSFIAVKLTDSIYFAICMFINVELIPFKNEEHQRQHVAAALKLKRLAATVDINSKEFEEEMLVEQKALSKYVRFGAAA